MRRFVRSFRMADNTVSDFIRQHLLDWGCGACSATPAKASAD
jgi:hypothetical protein